MDKGEVHLYYIPIKDRQRDLTRYRSLLSDREKGRADRYRFHESQERYVLGRGILRDILSGYLGMPPQEIEIAKRATGKPHLPSSPIQFNISHSNQCMLCAVTQTTPIGVDYQGVYEISHMETLVGSFFSPREQDRFHDTPEHKRRDFFFKTWVRKEAFMKATGLGFHLPSHCFSISESGNGGLNVQIEDRPSIHGQQWSIQDLNVQPGYQAALALKGEVLDLKHFYVT